MFLLSGPRLLIRNFNHIYQMKMVMIILHFLNKQESLDKFSHTYTRCKITHSFAAYTTPYKLIMTHVCAVHKYTMHAREHASIHIRGSHICAYICDCLSKNPICLHTN